MQASGACVTWRMRHEPDGILSLVLHREKTRSCRHMSGSTPAFIVVQDRMADDPDSNGMFVTTATLLAAAGAAPAVADCRGT